MAEIERPRKNRPRSKTRRKGSEDETLLDESTESRRRKARPERFDLLLQEAVAETNHNTLTKTGKKKKTKHDRDLSEKRRQNQLDKIKRGEGLVKDHDETLLANNTYDPDDIKSRKSNKRREQEQINGVKGKDNLAFEDETEVRGKGKGKGKKSSKKSPLIDDNENIDKDLSISELAASENKVNKKRKPVPGRARWNNEPSSPVQSPVQSPTPEDSEAPTDTPTKKKLRRKKRRPVEDTDEDRGLSDEVLERSGDDLEQSEDVMSPDLDEDAKPKVRKKKKRKKRLQEGEGEAGEEGAAAAEGEGEEEPPAPRIIPDDGRVVGITVHRTDKLKTDFYTAHPLVRISFVDEETGLFVKKQNRERIVASAYENQNENVDYILPIMTQPFDFKQHKSTLPIWEELVVFFENFNYISQEEPKVIIFFELLDFVSMRSASRKYNILKQEGGWHRIAWAFLRVVGATGIPNTDKKVRLQLYQPPVRFRAKGDQNEVYQWWQSAQRLPYPSTLYVTVKSIMPPSSVLPSNRSFFATQQERGKMTFDEMQRTLDLGASKRQNTRKNPNEWARLPGQMCRVPNVAFLKLPAGRLGCFVVKFSHDGKSIACGCHDVDGYPVLVYEFPSGKVKGRLTGHYGIVYDICWSKDDNSILTASSDGTARLWDSHTLSSNPEKLLPHPSFVYCAKFHNRVQKVVVTGSYDSIVRVWNLQTDDRNAQLMQELDGHSSYINSLCFDDEGARLFTGDGAGKIRVWNVYVTDQPSKRDATPGVLRDWSFNREVHDPEFTGSAINHIQLHPNGRRLMVHSRDNTIRMLDLRVLRESHRYAIMQRYHGALNFREHLRSTITPCGSFVIAGSEDAAAYMWNTETGDRVAMYSDLGYKSPVSDVDFHPHDHVVAFCSFSEHHPVLIYKYDFKAAQRDAGLGVDLTTVKHFKGRPGSPEIRPGTAMKTDQSDDDQLEGRRSRVASATGNFKTNEMSRFERVTRKLQAVTALSHGQPVGSQHPLGVRSPVPTATGNWGSTFDSTLMYEELLGQTATPAPGFMSPHATRTLSQSMMQQQFIAQADVVRQGDASGMWKPGFSSLGRSGMRTATPGGSKVPQLNMSMTQGKPQFTVQATTGGLDTEQVVALYDYQAQRSDELSFMRGDVVTVLYKDNDNWWMGELPDGNQGFFPANYVATEAEEVRHELDQDQDSNGYEDGVPGFTLEPATDEDAEETRTKTTAVVTKSGDLKFVSAPDDSDTDVTSPKRPARKKRSKPKIDKLSMENEMTPLKSGGRKVKKRSPKYEESEA